MRHTLTSGEAPAVGLRVIDYDQDHGTIIRVSDTGHCGVYCQAWHTVAKDSGGTMIFNCSRLTTRGAQPAPVSQ
jgi:hypothetical protein